MKHKKLGLILLYLALIALPLAFFFRDAGSGGTNAVYLLSGALGITSYVLLNFELLLVSRNKFLDKHFGLDRIYRYHMYIAVAAIAMALAHKLLKETMYRESLQTSLGDNAFIIFTAVAVLSILMMIRKLFFKVKPVDALRKVLQNMLKINYESKVLVHNLMVIGLVFLVVHILMAYSVKSDLPMMIILAGYFLIPFVLYLYRKIYVAYFSYKHKYIVSDIAHESGNIVTISFKPKSGKIFNYLPGQFLYVRIKNKGLPGDEHPFTISSSPTNKNHVSVTAKQLGDFTSKLGNVSIGSRAQIDGPYGIFSYKRSDNDKYCFIAGGIGITPFLSMLRYMGKQDDRKETVLLWGVRDESELICRKELESMTGANPRFKLVPVVSNDKLYQGEKGFVDQKMIEKYIKDVQAYDFFICGPPPMLEAQIRNLEGLGVPKNRIHYERFAI
jgi:predicted ferric reductase